MNFRRNTHNVDTSLFDPEHDLDLVALIDNARTEADMQRISAMSRSRMKARRAAIKGSTTNGRRSLIGQSPFGRRRRVAS
ncbi:MAG TPA: hypothetical protein VHV75_00335 [Solirubrobacteraceae bacterium]|jgi:hypothetical protein|nr:hypothetical protein [Solirubrobacteraceae bacterium]